MTYDVVVAHLPGRVPPGHEQAGLRPAVVVADPAQLGQVRFPMLVIVPLTTHRNQPWQIKNSTLYPILPAGTAGLPEHSIALIDQLQAIDAARVVYARGSLAQEEAEPIAEGLRQLFGIR